MEVDRMAEMLEKLVAVLARSATMEPAPRPVRSPVRPPRPAYLCWGCGERGHLRTECPQKQRELNFHGPRTPLPPAGYKGGASTRGTADRP